MTPTTERSEVADWPRWLLAATPLAALAAVVAVWIGIDAVGEIGGLDKAKLGWLVAIPLTILVPVLTAWSGGRLGGFARPILAAIVGLGAGVAMALPIWIAYAGRCTAVGLPIPETPIAATASIVGLTMFGAVMVAGVALDSDRPRAVRLAYAFGSAGVVFAIGFAVFVGVLLSLFFGQCVVRPQFAP
jgi:hypothetical protein